MIIGKDIIVTIVTPNGGKDVLTKVDTGATISSLDSKFFKDLELDEKSLKTILVKNTNGSEHRNVYEIDIVVNNKKIVSELNITDRSNMKYQMILGLKDISKLDAKIDIKNNVKKMKHIKTFEGLNRGYNWLVIIPYFLFLSKKFLIFTI